jgi:hypothetical protein
MALRTEDTSMRSMKTVVSICIITTGNYILVIRHFSWVKEQFDELGFGSKAPNSNTRSANHEVGGDKGCKDKIIREKEVTFTS